jgi:hypothetical protein
MEPHCGACGGELNEEYFCEACKRQCLCLEIRCVNEETLQYVQDFMDKTGQFEKFRAVLAGEGEKEGSGKEEG